MIRTKVKSEMALSWSCSRNDNGLLLSLRFTLCFLLLWALFFLPGVSFTPPWSTYKICTSPAPPVFTFLAIFYLVPGKLAALSYVAHWCLHLPLLEHIQQKSHPRLHFCSFLPHCERLEYRARMTCDMNGNGLCKSSVIRWSSYFPGRS